MKKAFSIAALAASTLAASAAIPTLSGLADAIEELRGGLSGRIAETSNRLAEARAEIADLRTEFRDRLAETTNRLDAAETTQGAIVLLIEGDKKLRESFHGGRIGQYVIENEDGRLIRVDLYADASVWTNGLTEAVRALADPEAEAKRLAALAVERERIQAAWEAANLPPDLAALRARQREVERQNAAAEAD